MLKSKKYLNIKNITGGWRARRVVIDKLTGQTSSYIGEMQITNRDDKINETSKMESQCFCLKERGVLTNNGKNYPFSQQYCLNLFATHCNVLFRDQLLFFQFKRVAEKQDINHLCGLDRYLGRIIFINETSFSLTFTVSGPSKFYYLKILYNR